MDIAQIGFNANTSDLVNARTELRSLVPAAGTAERAAVKLTQALNSGAKAALASALADKEKANAVLQAARASDTATKAEIASAAADKKKAVAAVAAARATEASTRAALANAKALAAEASATDRATASKMKYSKSGVPLIDGRTPKGPWDNNRPTPNNDNNPEISAGAMKANVSNIAAQLQDIGVTAAMGMNPLLIAFQQGTQLAMALGGGLRSVVGALAMVLGPTQLLTIAVVALVAAGLQMINWTSLAQMALNGLATILPQVSVAVAALGAAIAIAFAPTILALFWNTFLMIAAGIVGAVGSIVAAVGAIPLAIGLIIADLIIFRDEWAQVLGVDIVAAAKTGINYVIGAFVAAYHDIEFVWKNFPNVIGAAAIGAANMAIKAVNAIISASIAGLNKLIAGVNAITTLGGTVDGPTISPLAGEGINTFAEIANTAADDLAKAVGDRNKQLQADLSKDYLGAIGGAIEGAASDAAGKLKTFSAGLGIDDKKKKGGGGKSEGEKFEDIVRGAERSIAAMQAEKDALNMSAEAAAKLKYETQLLNEAQQKNIQLTPEQRTQLLGLAADMATLEVETAKAKDALDFAKDATKGFVSDFVSGLRNGKSAFESFTDALLNLANKLIDRGLNAIIDKLFEVGDASSSLGGGGGGGIGSWISKGLSWLFSAKGNAFDNSGVTAFAKGGSFTNSIVDSPTLFKFAKGTGVMGEAGPEAIMPLKRGPDGSLGVQMHNAQQQGGGSNQSNVSVQNNYKLEGAISSKEITEQIRAASNETVDTVKQSLMGWLSEFQRDGIMSN